jgi:hypothetical protein
MERYGHVYTSYAGSRIVSVLESAWYRAESALLRKTKSSVL